MRKINLLTFVFIFLASCTAKPITPTPISPEEAQQTAISFAWTSVVAAYTPTYTLTPTSVITKTPRPTSTPANTSTPTIMPLLAPKTDGFYLVIEEIMPGIWRSTGNGDQCYWEITTETGEILSNHYGMAGGTMFVPAEGFQVRVQGCGTWELLRTNN